MCANDAYIGLKDFGIIWCGVGNLFFRVTFVEGLEVSFDALPSSLIYSNVNLRWK